MSNEVYIGGGEDRAEGSVFIPKTIVAKPFQIAEKLRHMERLESDDLLEGDRRYQGLSKETREEFRNIFKLTQIKDGSRTVQVKLNLGLLNGGTIPAAE